MAAEPDVSLEDVVEGRATPEEVEAFNEARREQFSQRIEERQRERSEERQRALDALTGGEDAPDTTEVESGDVTLTVRTYASEDVKPVLQQVLGDGKDDPEVHRTLLPEVVAWFVEEPEEYADPDLWRDYAREFGTDELAIVFMKVLEPYADRAESSEVVRRFRRRADGAAVPRDE